MWRPSARWIRLALVGALLGSTLALNAGCGLTASLNRLRLDYIAQAEVSQARDEVATGGDFQHAQELAARAVELDPESLPVVRAAAGVFQRTEAWDRSLQALELYQSRTGAVDLYDMGAACVYSKREAAGTQFLEAYLANNRSLRATGRMDDEQLSLVLNNVGYTYADAGVNLTHALELTQEAQRLQPDSPTVADSVAWASYRLARYDEAAFYAERATRLQEPEDATVFYHAGAIHARQGRLILAEHELRRALELQPHLPAAQYELQRLRWQLPQPQRV